MTADARPGAASANGGSGRTVEIELKYRPRSIAVGERVLAADELAGLTPQSAIRTTQFDDRYLDTADGALARAGFAARLRTTPKGTLISVKSTARGSVREPGLHRREELEGPADRTAGPRDWPASDARALVLELSGDAPLVELVTVRQLRRRRIVGDASATIELSLDEVDVVARSQVVDRWVELELELVRGDESRLLDLGGFLERNRDFVPARGSKLERALAAARTHDRRGRPSTAGGDDAPTVAAERPSASPGVGARRRPRAAPEPEAAAPESSLAAAEPAAPDERAADGASAPPAAATEVSTVPSSPTRKRAAGRTDPLPKTPGIVPDDSVAEAGRKTLRFHFARMLAREAGARDGVEVRDVHAMRVATRRMRAAWRVFGDGFRPNRTKRLRSRLRDVAARLGGVRDLDVLLDGLEAYRAELPAAEKRALEPLVAAWRSYREDARVLLAQELDSPAYIRFVDDFRIFVQTEGLGLREVSPTEPHHVRDTAPSRIWSAYEQVRSYETVLRWADVETLHDLRIAAKWLRYTLEFVRETLGPDADPLIERVTALQDHLGWMHDADVSAAMARRFLTERSGTVSPGEAAAIGRYLLSREREVARLQRTVGPAYRGVVAVSFRRQLGRAVAAI
jgi:CHAD domain-containing protein